MWIAAEEVLWLRRVPKNWPSYNQRQQMALEDFGPGIGCKPPFRREQMCCRMLSDRAFEPPGHGYKARFEPWPPWEGYRNKPLADALVKPAEPRIAEGDA